jgi:DNA helicase-2/ATP-dependent DNA helicase PcrA
MPSLNNLAIIAAAGSRKTEFVIDQALAQPDKRVLITTYTTQNQRQIVSRIEQRVGVVPSNIAIMGWFTFLLNEAARPYQNFVTNRVGHLKSLNFVGAKSRFASKTSLSFFFDSNRDMFRDGVSDFACIANEKSGGKVISRLESMFDHIYIDEVQDLCGYDLDFLDLLLRSSISVTVVGDPRQDTLATNNNMRNHKYKKNGLVNWFEEREAYCAIEERNFSHRCSQPLLDFADDLFPTMSRTTSKNTDVTSHDGVFVIPRDDVASYFAEYSPTVLRESKSYDTMGLPALNIGVSKGSTYERVLIFSTKTMLKYVKDRDLSKLKTNERLYVAVTRARFSAAFVE